MDTVGTSIFPSFEGFPSSEVEMFGQLMARGKQFLHCRELSTYQSVHCRRFDYTYGFTLLEYFLCAATILLVRVGSTYVGIVEVSDEMCRMFSRRLS